MVAIEYVSQGDKEDCLGFIIKEGKYQGCEIIASDIHVEHEENESLLVYDYKVLQYNEILKESGHTDEFKEHISLIIAQLIRRGFEIMKEEQAKQA